MGGVSVLLACLLLGGSIVEPYKILMVYPSYSKSHLIIATAAMEGLAEEGHQVTVVSSFPQKEEIPNYRDIYLEFPPSLKNQLTNTVANDNGNLSPRAIYKIFCSSLHYFNSTMGHPELQRMMREESFDLFVTTPIGGRMLSGLATHFGCPLVYLTPVRVPLEIANFMGNPSQLSSVASLITTVRIPRTFWERVKNFILSATEFLLFSVLDIFEGYYYKSNFASSQYPPYAEARANASLVLSAHHFSQGVVANLPQIVDIGGIQMDLKLASLGNLQSYLDDASEGVIFFSFGTNVNLKKLNQDKLWEVFRALGRTERKVLLKYDTDEEISGLPQNILTSSWLPQREVLAHPNVKLFISHGGLGSVMESKYYGVPLLGIPAFGDQPANVQMAAEEGWAIQLDWATITEEKVSEAVKSILNNNSFSEKVTTLSNVYRDRPIGPLKTAVYWLEYVIRHKGAPHMRSPAANQNFMQKTSLDVIIILLGVFYGFMLIIKNLFRLVKRLFSLRMKGANTKKLN